MQKPVTLKQNTEFHRAYGRGKVKASPSIVTYVVKNRGQGIRMGITAAKKLGSAVERNRCRRIIRAAFSSIYPQCSGNYDIVFVARFKTKKLRSSDLEPVMRSHLTELGVASGSVEAEF
ncbi:MAG: ribonuclease P protein component [Acutalibacteraceae bacterium]|nr:ribonuclease P protein component [Acutalibacteraceae bacterium]